MKTYEYSSENRLEKPNYYMYTPFEGREFLDVFLRFREEKMSQLKAVVKTGVDPLKEIKKLQVNRRMNSRFQSMESQSTFKTKEVIEGLLIALFNYDERWDQDIYKWLAWLVRKFEVQKKLYASYELKKGSGSTVLVENYAHLSLVLILYYERCENLKFLNAVLKINDLLCSLPQNSFSEDVVRYATLASLKLECTAIRKLMERKGV